MSDTNKPEEIKWKARTVYELHRDALDSSTDFFNIALEFTRDERVDFMIRMEYFKLVSEALQKSIDRGKVLNDTPSA